MTNMTSIYLKSDAGQPLPGDDECYYLLTRSGLFIGRNTSLQKSLVPARDWPRGLAEQKAQLELSYPTVPGELLSQIFGFFWTIASRHGAEAAVLLAWDEEAGLVRPIVPRQIATVSWGWKGEPYPIGLHYEIPALASRGLRLIGDLHSHAFESAYASATDVADEEHAPGLHVVAGRLDRDPPDLHVEYVVDGARFPIDPVAILDLDGYDGRTDDFDRAWLDRVEVESAAAYRRRRADGHGLLADREPPA